MKARYFKSLLCMILSGFAVFSANAATSLFSDYGQIQNVQNYSSNPFWTPNAPYNQRLPQPVYVQGADLNTEDCIKVVQSLVAVQCMARDNCKSTALADIRPAIMVQLSNLPGKNYVTACAGYIDGVFESYVAQYGVTAPKDMNRAVAFPNATVPNTSTNDNNGVQLYNPYKIQTPEWKQDIIDRSQELKKLQNQNAGNNNLSAAAFPTTYADLSFSERMQNAAAGYAPYKDLKAYKIPDFKTAEEWCSDAEHSGEPYCVEYFDKKKDKAEEVLQCTKEAIARAKTLKGYANDTDTNILYARKTPEHKCEVMSCSGGYHVNSSKTLCLNLNCKDELQDKSNVVYAQRDSQDGETGVCKIIECTTGYIVSNTGLKCIKKDCKSNFSNKSHVVKAERDAYGNCSIKECAAKYIAVGSQCIEKDCSQHAKDNMDENADKAERYSDGSCHITKCKNSKIPTNNGASCGSGTTVNGSNENDDDNNSKNDSNVIEFD